MLAQSKKTLKSLQHSLFALWHTPRCQRGRERLTQYARLVRLDKPIGILLLLWPALWSVWIAAAGKPDWSVVIIMMLGATCMRSAGCAINDYADRNIDGQVRRTRQRPLATGKVSPKEALLVFTFLSLAAFGLVLMLHKLAIQLAFAGILLVSIYPFMKRHTHLPQLFLGITFGWSVPMAYAAQAHELTRITWLLYIATALWIVAFDTQYAMVDKEDDLKLKVKSTAILFGDGDVPIIITIQLLALYALLLIGQQLTLSFWYFSGLLTAGLIVAYQFTLIRTRNPAHCFKAFLSNNYFGLTIFTGLALHYLLT